MLLKEPQKLWAAQNCGHIRNRDTEQQWLRRDSRSVTHNSLLANPGSLRHFATWEGAFQGSSNDSVYSQRGNDALLWRQCFLDPSLWWDCRQDTKALRCPDLNHKRLKELLWLKNGFTAAWVGSHLATWEVRMTDPSARCSKWKRDEGDATVEACSKLCKNGQLSEAVGTLDLLVHSGARVSTSLFYALIRKCVVSKNLVLGRQVHALAIESGYQSNTFLSNHILRMYASQGTLQEAMHVFTRVAAPDVFMWSSIISAHSDHGDPVHGIQLYHQMRDSVAWWTCMPNAAG